MTSVAFSPDGHTLAAGSDGHDTVTLWDVTDPTRPTQIGQPLTGPVDVTSVAFSPDGHGEIGSRAAAFAEPPGVLRPISPNSPWSK